MMGLLTGNPGAGKTLRAMSLLLEAYNANKEANALPREHPKYEDLRLFYTNIEGATKADNPNAFPWLLPIPESNDWRELPDGSFIVYDEAHQDHLFPQEGASGARAKDKRVRDMDTHRHRGIDMWFVTQWPNKVHHELRTLCQKHIHHFRASGVNAALCFTWGTVQGNPDSSTSQKQGTEELWRFPKELFKRFKSATLHTAAHKFKIPKRIVLTVFQIIVFVAVAWGLFGWWIPSKLQAKAPEEAGGGVHAQAGTPPPAGQSSLTAPIESGLPAGFVQVPDPDAPPAPLSPQQAAGLTAQGTRTRPAACLQVVKCKCYDTNGERMELDEHRCRAYLTDFGYVKMRFDNEQETVAPGLVQSQSVAPAGVGNPATAVIQGQSVAADIPPPAAAPVSAGTSSLAPMR